MKNSRKIRRSILSQPYLADLLLFLKDHGEIMANELIEVHSNYPKMMALVLRLQILGLIDIREEHSPHLIKRISLSKKGKELVTLIERFDEIASKSKLVRLTSD
jgi:hypothetical protein